MAYGPDGSTRLVAGNGLATRTGSVDVYDVSAPAGARLTADPEVVVGGPDRGAAPEPRRTGGPAAPRGRHGGRRGGETGQVLTDSLRRRETNFAAVRWNESATMPAGTAYRLVGPEHAHRFLDDPERWETTAVWTGAVADVTASSSEAYADALPPLRIGSHPGAALDGDPATGWRSARQLDPTGQWWQADLDRLEYLGQVTVRLTPDSAAVPRLALRSDQGTEVVPGPRRRAGPAPTTWASRARRSCASPRPAATCACPGRSASPRSASTPRWPPSATCSCRCPTSGSRWTRSRCGATPTGPPAC